MIVHLLLYILLTPVFCREALFKNGGWNSLDYSKLSWSIFMPLPKETFDFFYNRRDSRAVWCVEIGLGMLGPMDQSF